MEIQVVAEAVEYAVIYNKKIEKVSFYIHEKSIVMSGIDHNDELVSGAQMEISKEDFIKLSKIVLNQ
jgi:hypothetical protein